MPGHAVYINGRVMHLATLARSAARGPVSIQRGVPVGTTRLHRTLGRQIIHDPLNEKCEKKK